jgi:hypothetical protein
MRRGLVTAIAAAALFRRSSRADGSIAGVVKDTTGAVLPGVGRTV